MMECKTKFLNWQDVKQIIFEHFGVQDEEKQKTHCEMLTYSGNINIKHEKDNVIELRIFDKDYSTRLREHMGE